MSSRCLTGAVVDFNGQRICCLSIRAFRPSSFASTSRYKTDIREFLIDIAGRYVNPAMTMSEVEHEAMTKWPGIDVTNKLCSLEEPMRRPKLCYATTYLVALETISKGRDLRRPRELGELRPYPPICQDLEQAMRAREVDDSFDALFLDW